MKNLVILSVACAGLSAVRMAAAAEEPTTEIPLPTFERTPLDELLGNSTVHDGTEEWDWGGDTIPIVKNTRTGPLTTEELRNATHVAMDYKEAYLLFKKTYNRSYGDNAEEQRRYSYFVRNMASAFFNQTANPYATFGANNFSDMTPREFLPFHNLTDVSDDYLNKSAAYASTTKAPSATTIDGYDILHNAFDLSFALKDVNGEYSVLGQGNKFWGAAQAEGIASDLMAAEERRMAGAAVNAADETSDDDLAKTSSGAGGVKAAVSRVKKSAKSKILRGVKALRALLTSTRGDGKAQSDDADWVRIEEAYTVVKDSFASWDEQKEKSKEQADHETLQSAAKSFSELESEYLKMKKERKGSESEAVAPPSGTVVPPENPAVAEAVGRSFNAMATMPQVLDWRLYGAVTPVRNQGFCGGCWAFATAGNIEGVWRIAGKPLTQLSEQSLISCDTYSGNMGCAGGVPQYAYNFVIKYQNGLMSRLDYYPFSSGSGVAPLCTAAQQVAGAAINRYVSIARDENVIMQYVANIGPVTAAIDSISWQSYSGGIMTNCLGLSVDHAVLIVGYDNNFTVPYWIIKNSWGTDWGEKGYIRVAKGSNQCLITTNPSTALAAAAVTILDPTTTSPPTTTMNTTTPANTTTPTTPAGTTVVPVPEVTTQKNSTAKPATTQTATTTGPKLTIRPVTDTPIIDIPGGILDDVDKELSFAVRIPISTAFVGVLFVAAAFMA